MLFTFDEHNLLAIYSVQASKAVSSMSSQERTGLFAVMIWEIK